MKKWNSSREAAVDYFMTLQDSEVSDFSFEGHEIHWLPPEKNDRNDAKSDTVVNILSPDDVCGHFSILTDKMSISPNSL
ncbi:hypothetical protein NPIL_17611 [Nephila pilipes]|uniref:Uncharacterized protein n=1 Tax=Nephila pilipes TaxID=299642 RepID=A0A8X6Q6X5_NEPPI|nr:hypothetical protein NPIL_17611 [Nephila pilipes]